LQAIPLSTEPTLRVAIHDPFHVSRMSNLREKLGGREIEFVLADEGQLAGALDRLAGGSARGDQTGEALLERYLEVASGAPTPRQLHHLPFIPWIALGALTFVILFPFFRR
jgi:hypothetical protein